MRNKTALAWAFLLLALVLVILGGLLTGPSDFSFGRMMDGLLGRNESASAIIYELRLPRVLMGLISGGILSLAGLYMQAMVRNPMADPYLLGLSSGAGFGVNLLILGIIPITGFTALTFPLAAFAGGMISFLFLLGLMQSREGGNTFRILIGGIAISSLFTALTGLMIYLLAENDQIRRFLYWTFGDLSHTGWEGIIPCAIVLFISWIGGWMYAPAMDVLVQGEKESRALGLDPKQARWVLILLTTLSAGTAISFTGPIGFVGLMMPHFSRAVLGGIHRRNVLFLPLCGGIFLAACDLVSQWIRPPAGLPIGVITALAGVPFFLYLLTKSGR